MLFFFGVVLAYMKAMWYTECSDRQSKGVDETMRKLIIMFSVVLVAIGLSACSDNEIKKEGSTTVGDKQDNDSTSKEELEEEFGEIEYADSDIEDKVEEVKVTDVIDGDTIVIESKNGTETVQFLLIDTPEIGSNPDEPKQKYSIPARKFTKRLVGRTVKFERGNPETNKDGDTVGFVWLENGADHITFNELLVSQGLARIANVDANKANAGYLDSFKEAEAVAKERNTIIWFYDGYVTDSGFSMAALNNG